MDNTNSLIRLGTAVLLFFYFEVGYSWAAAGHDAADIFSGNSSWDNAIPLMPIFIIPYMLGYLFVLLPLLLTNRNIDFYWGTLVFFLGVSGSLLAFKLFPIHLEKTYAVGEDFWSQLTLFQQKADNSMNNCPSLHVTLNVYCWMVLRQIYGKPVMAFLPIPLLILVSTLLVKQHLIIDVIGGTLLGVGMGTLFSYGRTRIINTARLFNTMIVFLFGFLFINFDELNKAAQLLTKYIVKTGWLGGGLALSIIMAAFLLKMARQKSDSALPSHI